MSTPTLSPYDWIREIPSALKLLDESPLIGYPPPFPYEDFADKLGKTLNIPDLNIKLSVPEWRIVADLSKGLADELYSLNIALAPIEGVLTFLFSKQDLASLLSEMIQAVPPVVLDSDYLEGFTQFLMLEALTLFQTVEFDKSLTPQILSSKEMPKEDSLCWDITIGTPHRTIHGRLVASQSFRKKWKERFAQRSLTVPSALTQQIEVTVHIEAGNTTLPFAEWSAAAPGDFILLDACTLSTEEEKGRVMLTLNGKPVFRARVKQGTLKILEYPMFYEVNTPMAKYNPGDEEEEFEQDGETEDEEFLEDDETVDTELEDEPSTDEEFDGESENELEEETEEDAPEAGLPRPGPKNRDKGGDVAHSTESHAAPSPEEIPVTVVVEVGRFQISVQKLMDLQPGNLLELNVHPENGIDLVINGRCVAKGELLKIGELLGVRILDMVT